jgi:hypothetical protein
MVAVRVSPDHRPAIVGSSGYFDSHPRPESPRDLLQHRCINFRHGRDEIYRWDTAPSETRGRSGHHGNGSPGPVKPTQPQPFARLQPELAAAAASESA